MSEEGESNEVQIIDTQEELIDSTEALRRVLKDALVHDQLARGLHESCKALERKEAVLCVLSTGCSEKAYKSLVKALTKELKIPLVEVEDSKKLGEWSGLCKIDREGAARKVVGASCVVVKAFGKDVKAQEVLMSSIQ